MTQTQPQPTFAMLALVLPGPDRKRKRSLYQYRVTYRNPNRIEPGCAMTWEVAGGRELYQIALERTTTGAIRWHCTCADAVYRGDRNPGHVCKHVDGLRDLMSVAA